MITSLTETSNETNKIFFTNVCVLLFISNLYLKKFKQFCLGELLIKKRFEYFQSGFILAENIRINKNILENLTFSIRERPIYKLKLLLK